MSGFRLPLVSALLLALASCERPWNDGEKLPFTTTDSVTDLNESILRLYGLVTWIDTVILIVVGIVYFFTIARWRHDGTSRKPEQVHGNTPLEIGWTLAPVVIVIGLLVPTVRTIFELGDAAPKNALEIRVIGKRWWWAFEYVKSGVMTANELHIPAGRPVSLILESDTVIHSFWTPRLGGKRDAVPGRQNRLWFTVTEPIAAGAPVTFRGECAEYCGESHALMRHEVVAHEASEFDAWLTSMATPPAPAEDPEVLAGKEKFVTVGCAGCHTVRGNDLAKGVLGPDLTRFGTRQKLGASTEPNTREMLVKWILDPNSIKPGTTMEGNPSRGAAGANDGMNIPGDDPAIPGTQVSQADAEAIAAYLHALK
jgi:cytochrome c oxidase subunit II